MNHLKNKRFYGSVTVGERGQIVIPVEARRDFDIQPGEKLLVLADLEKGIVIAKGNVVLGLLGGTLEGLRKLESIAGSAEASSRSQKRLKPKEGSRDEASSP
jgi:AbrB family looped-hinge helix DNA binding protein